MTDDEFLAAFESGTYPKPDWTHAAHIRMAWLYLTRFPRAEALDRIREGIKRYNAAVGGPANGYHETVTCVYAHLVHDRVTRDGGATSWEDFRASHGDLLDRAAPPPLRYYSAEVITSAEARARFVAPDLQPLPLTPDDKLDLILLGPLGVHLKRPDTRVVERPGWYQVITPSCRHSFLNEVIVTDVPASDADRLIDTVVAEYGALGVPFKWCVGPRTRPTDLGDRLRRRGLHEWDVAGMLADASRLAPGDFALPEGVTVEAVTETNLEEFVSTYLEGWEFSEADRAATAHAVRAVCAEPEPRRRFYLARDGAAPAGTASFFIKDHTAYLTGGNVLKRRRGRGIYRALVCHRLEELRRRKIFVAATQARRQSSAPILERLGFETVCTSKVFLSAAN